jgi:DNA-directed RNA polymerase sigma subunit (sigma70/sigma32)
MNNERKELFNLGMAVSALTMVRGQRRTYAEIAAYVSAAGRPITRQAIEHIEKRALRKLRRTGLVRLAGEHLVK